jgi:ribosomal-protein-alanine N-acetyltransferase
MNIIPMAETHIQDVAEIERQCFHAPWSAQALREELGNQHIFLVAEENGQAIGYVGCQVVLDEGYITNVAVLPAARRRGIASALLDALAWQGQALGLTFITLEVRAANHAALAVYQKQGYVQVGIRPGFYRDPKEDAILMTKYFTREGESYDRN